MGRENMDNIDVPWDYRKNRIIVDWDNPILAFKANRDRSNGKPQISSPNSEDALTWNVFRTLQKNNMLGILRSLFNNSDEIHNPKILLWTLSFSDESNELQFEVGDKIRHIDGKHKGQITEPDIVIETNSSLYVVECKLGSPLHPPSHLWDAGENSGSKKRMNDYFNGDSPFMNGKEVEALYCGEGYQLFRMAYYAHQLAKAGKQPYLISITNEKWWEKKHRNGSSAASIWNEFMGCINKNKTKLLLINVFWQQIRNAIRRSGENKLEEILSYLDNHQCL